MTSDLKIWHLLHARRWHILGLFALILYAVFPALEAAMTESRAYRDAAQLTAYHSVTLDHVVVETPKTILIDGTLIKRRCDPVSLTAYVENSVKSRLAPLDLSPDGTGPEMVSRPPSRMPQDWGPWRITTTFPDPKSFCVYTRHRCPNETALQINTFLCAPWPAPGAKP